MTRTFEGQPFRLKEHIDRFYRSLRYLQIDPGVSPKEMVANSEEVVARNEHLRPAVGDWWVGQRVSRGVLGAVLDQRFDGLPLLRGHWEQEQVAVLAHCATTHP